MACSGGPSCRLRGVWAPGGQHRREMRGQGQNCGKEEPSSALRNGGTMTVDGMRRNGPDHGPHLGGHLNSPRATEQGPAPPFQDAPHRPCGPALGGPPAPPTPAPQAASPLPTRGHQPSLGAQLRRQQPHPSTPSSAPSAFRRAHTQTAAEDAVTAVSSVRLSSRQGPGQAWGSLNIPAVRKCAGR